MSRNLFLPELPKTKPYLVIKVDPHNIRQADLVRAVCALLVDHGVYLSEMHQDSKDSHEIHIWHDIDFNDWAEYDNLVGELYEVISHIEALSGLANLTLDMVIEADSGAKARNCSGTPFTGECD